jgi:hypothetical protein
MSLLDTAGRVCLCPQLNLLDRKWHINVRYPTQAKVRLEMGHPAFAAGSARWNHFSHSVRV